jgi:hypothetical protein
MFGKAQEGTGNLILSRTPSAVNLNDVPCKGKALKMSYNKKFFEFQKNCVASFVTKIIVTVRE